MADLLAPIISRYTNYTMTGDGIPEINSLAYIPFESGYDETPSGGRLALVLIEPRLLDVTSNPGFHTELLRCLQRFKGDLRAEGLHTRFIVADLYRGPVHKDGQSVLALRQFFREVKSSFTSFEGAILIGNFPEASLVRRVSWCPGFLSPRQLAIGTEMISERADIVLADLTGNWESLYQQNDFTAEDISAIPDANTVAMGWFDGGESVLTGEFTSADFTIRQSNTFKDTFYLDDAIYTILENRASPSPFLRIRLNQGERNNEVDVNDRTMVNILSRPDISVSRINAYHVAVNPNPSLRGTDGNTFLDATGNPQTVNSPSPLFNNNAQHIELFNFNDFDLERQLLISYFNRNHRFRNGTFSNLPFRGAVISGTTDFNPDWYEGLVNAAATDFQPCVKTANADLQQYVQFHKTPAILKYIIAHSDALISQFRAGYDVTAFTAEAGGPPLRWIYRSGQHIPSFEDQGGTADMYVHRTLWHYNTLQQAGASFIIHGGCNVNSVYESQSDTYVSANYARWNNAEGILFYSNCVSLFSRAKGFNDSPNGFADGYRLSDRANFGSCWKSYFNAQANDGGLSTYNIQRKRGYFWSINGDWTLRLRNRNGLGILSLNGGLHSIEVHPNRAWIDGWNYDASVNRIRGIGDVDGDGTDEFIVVSDWGIGILKYTGFHFRALMTAPRDTWFGGWRYDATVNSGRDRIMAVENFTDTSKSEILVWSTWGITTLQYNGGSLVPSRIHANGTRLGEWVINTNDNVYCGSGQLDGDGIKDMIVMSPWGLGIISLQNSTHVYMAPNGTRLGGWLLNSGDNTVRLVADFDGDGMDELFISSPWGIGILKIQDGALTSVAMHANGENVSGYTVSNTHIFALADNLQSGAGKQILVVDASGIHMICLVGNSLVRQAFAANGSRIDGWVIDTGNNWLQPVGDMNTDGSAEFVIRSPWGVGIMGIDAANNFRCYCLFPYMSVLNDWYLENGDVIVGFGNLSGGTDRKELLIVKP
jgi:hypothetical protein